MSRFVIHDPDSGGFWKTILRRVQTPQEAKAWKTLRGALDQAGISNCSRNIPPGHSGPSKHYQQRPNLTVHEYDGNWELVATHPAPPAYISVTIGP